MTEKRERTDTCPGCQRTKSEAAELCRSCRYPGAEEYVKTIVDGLNRRLTPQGIASDLGVTVGAVSRRLRRYEGYEDLARIFEREHGRLSRVRAREKAARVTS